MLYPVSFDFALLTLTVFTTLRKSMGEKIHSIETAIEASQESNVKVVTNVKQKHERQVKRIKDFKEFLLFEQKTIPGWTINGLGKTLKFFLKHSWQIARK